MGEKKKWFDRQPLQLPEPIQSVSNVSVEEAGEVLRALYRIRGLKASRAAHLMSHRAAMLPARRLARNLKILLGLLADGNVNSIIPEGLTDDELQALIVLQTHETPPAIREAAQGLLNVYERYLLLAAVKRMFREEHTRPWEITLANYQAGSSGIPETPPVPRDGGRDQGTP